MWRDSLYREASPIPVLSSCNQCPSGLLKYIQFLEFPSFPIRFFVDTSSGPPSSTGIIQVHYWTSIPPSAPPFTNRVWLANIPVGGSSFYFQPTPSQKYLSLFKKNSSGSFKAICFKYIPQSRLFVPQTFS